MSKVDYFKGEIKMRTDDYKAMDVCKEAGVEVGTGTMVLITTMTFVYSIMHNIGEAFINLIK